MLPNFLSDAFFADDVITTSARILSEDGTMFETKGVLETYENHAPLCSAVTLDSDINVFYVKVEDAHRAMQGGLVETLEGRYKIVRVVIKDRIGELHLCPT